MRCMIIVLLIAAALSCSSQHSHWSKIPEAIEVPTHIITAKNKNNNIKTNLLQLWQLRAFSLKLKSFQQVQIMLDFY